MPTPRCSSVARAIGWTSLLALLACSSARPPDGVLAGARVAAANGSNATAADVTARRDAGRLADARATALALVAERPADAGALRLASRAESDALFFLPSDAKDQREIAAWSALELAERAVAAGAVTAADHAQLAWSRGAVTHLLPMLDRAEHAHLVLDAVGVALALDPNEPTALATLATLKLRLATLPWIARIFASGAPDASLDEALVAAERAFGAEASLENALLVGRVLRARGENPGAVLIVSARLAGDDRYPRDQAVRAAASAFVSGD